MKVIFSTPHFDFIKNVVSLPHQYRMNFPGEVKLKNSLEGDLIASAPNNVTFIFEYDTAKMCYVYKGFESDRTRGR